MPLKRCCVLILLLILLPAVSLADLWAEFVDVGAGDCILIGCDGHFMVIDTGPARSWPQVRSEILRHHMNTIDILLITHPHPDHMDNTGNILERCSVLQAMVSGAAADLPAERSLESVLDQNDIPVLKLFRGDRFMLGSARITVLWPTAGEPIPPPENNTSVVLRIDYGTFSMLLTGDAELDAEASIAAGAAEIPLHCTLMKCGHHGMTTSTGYPFLHAASPMIAVISCGSEDQTATVSPDTIEHLTDAGVQTILTTKDHGTLSIQVNESGLLTIR